MFNPDFFGCVSVLDSARGKQTYFEVIEYERLFGAYDTKKYQPKSFINKLRQVRIRIDNASIVTEAGALQFLKGNIQMKTDNSLGGLVRGMISSTLSSESAVKPVYSGTGEVWLVPAQNFVHNSGYSGSI